MEGYSFMLQPTDPQEPKTLDDYKIITTKLERREPLDPPSPNYYYVVEEYYDPINKGYYKRKICDI